jgi:O-antigen ligase
MRHAPYSTDPLLVPASAAVVNTIGAVVLACLAIAAPTLLAYNAPPSATFLNQAVSLIGWGGFVLLLALVALPSRLLFRSGSISLLLSLALLGLAAILSWAFAGLPGSLALSSLGVVAAAAAVVWAGIAVAQTEHAQKVFDAVCVALVLAGVLSVAIGMIQVFAPSLADGDWIAAPAQEGRASGNLRQPNHLASLLLWSAIGAVALTEAGRLRREVGAALVGLLVFGLVLTASRTGTVGVVMLALWGLLDRRLSKPARLLLVVTPLAYVLMWLGVTELANGSQRAFGGQARLGESDISGSRFKIWSDTWDLIKQHPWTGVGFGEFNFAWSLTPFPNRPIAFFDHTHNLPLQFAVELGLPLAGIVLALLGWALWCAFAAGADKTSARAPMLRAAFMIVLMSAVHSLLEYPLWYAYFLLPTAFVFGLAVGSQETNAPPGPAAARQGRASPLLLAGLLMIAGGAAALYDFTRVVVIFSADDDAPPLAQRIADGQKSWFFAHHADYAAATTATNPASAMPSFKIATHYLLDTRLMMAWANALAESGDIERARHIAQRLREFRNEDSKAYFDACLQGSADATALPYQCTSPKRALDYRDFIK